ncbi:heparinase II/III family protein [Pseudoalteromonas sp. A25]|uniref:heparinase II/III family protein n=1 Tax=Pseudoalteromonas sp. A25 TaxID=116092 RepID=UPI001E5730CD|nr:alginate lyase family protein [Pseudoalteromonas sp. A25]
MKYLKFKQFYYRLLYKITTPTVYKAEPTSCKCWVWCGPEVNPQSITSETTVKFLNQTGSIVTLEDWNCPSKTKLWLYNLHYFDDLSSFDSFKRYDLQRGWIERWIADNPPCLGNGWEPYPISLRLVNWVKWCSKQKHVSPAYTKSMLEQADALSKQLEYHILGNHLFANAKALTFVGAYLNGEQAERYLNKGIDILDKEISEQFLDDGAHFELSPMYHEILLWDLLELIDLAHTSDNDLLKKYSHGWRAVAVKALTWLQVMIHPDGEISFFNDAAIGIAKQPKDIFSYAKKLGILCEMDSKRLITNPTSGYSRVTFDEYTLIFDHANVGPDYLPGHAHADTLSFELSIGEQRVFVNSGTSLYGISEERLRQRETAAHNTVTVEGCSSSQVWSGFRVAKRAYAKLNQTSYSDGRTLLVASHDGYLKQSPKLIHTRKLECSGKSIKVHDDLSHAKAACLHLNIHPELDIVQTSARACEIFKQGTRLCVLESDSALQLKDSTWHPEFGKSVPNKKIEINFNSGSIRTEIRIIKGLE